MTSELKAATSRLNGAKSNGPTSEAGKMRSRMNAVKHGMTAKTVILPDEDPAEFQQLMTGYFDSLKPKDQFEASLVEQAVYVMWQCDRCTRAESARLYLRAHSRADEEEHRVEQEVTALLQTLLRAPHGRPTAVPFTERAADERGSSTWAATFEYAEHPARLIGRLEASGHGCDSLLHCWGELEALVKNGSRWEAPERFRAFRLMGMHPIDTYMTIELAMILQACQVLDPGAGRIVGEVWNEGVPEDALAALETRYQQDIGHMPTPDREAARQYLLEVVKQETERLEEKARRHEERAEVAAELASYREAFDESREGALFRRYQLACQKLFFQHLSELSKHRGEKPPGREAVISGRYFRPTPLSFRPLGGTRDESETSGLNGGMDGNREAVGGDEGAAGTGGGKRVARGAWRVAESADGGAAVPAGGDRVTTDANRAAGNGGGVVAAAERLADEQSPQAVVDRPRLERGYQNKTMTGSKRERRRLRRLERENRTRGGGRKIEVAGIPGQG